MEEKKMFNEETVNETIEETVTEPTDEVNEEDVMEDESTAEFVFGTVTGCKKLNIRTKPVVNPSNIITIVDAGTMVMVDPEGETGEWYKVVTANDVEGYCMKEFVTID